MIDATRLKAHPAAKLLKRALPKWFGRTEGGLNSKLHAVCDDESRPIVMMLTAGQMSDYKGAVLSVGTFVCSMRIIPDKNRFWLPHNVGT